jgi:hypothetical protein
VLSESSSLSELDVLVRKCIDEGAADGFAQYVLDEASGGDLIVFIREAIVRSAGGCREAVGVCLCRLAAQRTIRFDFKPSRMMRASVRIS